MGFQIRETIVRQPYIIPAGPEHAEIMHEIASSLLLSHTSDDSKNNGFVLFVPTQETYLQRITNSRHIFVAMDSEEISGFITAFTHAERVAAGREVDPAVRALTTLLGDHYVFADQLAIARGYERSRIGQLLWDHFVRSCPAQRIAGFIAESPVKNTASIEFFKKNGMVRISEFEDGNGLRGIYLLKNDVENHSMKEN